MTIVNFTPSSVSIGGALIGSAVSLFVLTTVTAGDLALKWSSVS